MWGRSHVTFMGKLADILVEEGHEVVSIPSIRFRLEILQYHYKSGTTVP